MLSLQALNLNTKFRPSNGASSAVALPNRRRIRIRVMQALYATLVGHQETQQVYECLLSDMWENLRKNSLEQADQENDEKFLLELYYGTLKHRDELEKLIAPKLEHWDLDRVAWVDRIILLMGLYEILYCPEIPIKVSINEYIDIAKEYSTEKSSQFVNGVLDALHQDLATSKRIHKVGRGLLN